MAADPPAPSAADYLLFEPGPFGFPPPSVAITAPLRQGALRWRADPAQPVPAWGGGGGTGRLYSRARYALHDAFKLSGVGPQGALLAPSLHCRTMLDPALALGAPLALYALSPTLDFDLDDIAHRLRPAGVPVKAVLAPHFFGLRRDLRALAALCRRQGVALIEDCAHALPLRGPSNQMGDTGTWCVASPYKFFPCEDGGALWAGDGSALPPLPALRKPSLRSELGQLRSLRAKASLRPPDRITQPAVDSAALSPAQQRALAQPAHARGPSSDYQSNGQALACSAVSKWIIGHADIAQIVARRRQHYQRWVQAVEGLAGARALHPVLGEHDTPYMFPLLIDQPERQFAALKHAGLPIWRWDSLATSDCPIAARYRLQLLQLPCHQGLSAAELGWMIGTLRAALQPQGGSTGAMAVPQAVHRDA